MSCLPRLSRPLITRGLSSEPASHSWIHTLLVISHSYLMSRSSRAQRRARGFAPSAPPPQHRSFALDALLTRVAADAPLDSYVDRLSDDGCFIHRESIPIQLPSPVKRARLHAPDTASLAGSAARVGISTGELANECYIMDSLDEGDNTSWGEDYGTNGEGGIEPQVHRIIRPADPAMHQWMLSEQDTYLQVFLWREGKGDNEQMQCAGCGDSIRPQLRCRECMGGCVQWTGVYFKKMSLKVHGLRVQIGHPPGEKCTRRFAGHSEFIVLHVNGIHDVTVDFCGCKNQSVAWYIQLLQAGWYPATTDRPQTCATIACLDHYQALSLHTKTSAYDYYSLLEYLTDATSAKHPSRYQCARRGHEDGGVAGMGPGAGTQSPRRIGVCMFLQLHWMPASVSNGEQSPTSFEIQEPYRKYLLSARDQNEISTCTGLAALDYANTKFSRGYATTGIGMGVCARHEFVQPNGSNRYANIDYIVGSFMRHIDPRLWKIRHCMSVVEVPQGEAGGTTPLVRLHLVLALCRFVIPKMHIKRHATSCQVKFSLNFAMIGGTAASTRASGPGLCADQLNDHWQFWNWSKLVGLPSLLCRRLDAARVELQRHNEAFKVFTTQQVERVPEWKALVNAYERDNSAKNPYSMETKGLTEMQVRARFEKEEAKDAKAGRARIYEVSPSGFITTALDLKDQHAQSTALKINLRSAQQRLNRGIQKFRKLQATYCPAALFCLVALNIPANTLAEDIPLVLPSDLSEEQRAGGGCAEGLLQLEREMREAQCRTALVSLRMQLSIKARFLIYKKNHSRAQAMNTRSRTLIAWNENKIRLHSEKYQRAHAALVAMTPDGEPAVGWWRLRKANIQCMEDHVQLSRRKEKERRTREHGGVGSIPALEAEGMIAYAMKQADVYWQLISRAERTRTEPKLGRGHRRPREAIRVGFWPTQETEIGDEDVGQEEDDEEEGFVDSDDEAILDGGEHD
ncbi:hypothetical protein GGX14DRAFT_569495 [Mycena pura]|uniref:CxC2-like cysteine cluster KDZ transposase-associated domain-containing protein n=1 Tax=Mycena pura TaxID=153505 RepID=A0AAD6Y6N8_9AGAR|nr:hypothetical protein GGX14DRAFT_569495 [Mycena pura]